MQFYKSKKKTHPAPVAVSHTLVATARKQQTLALGYVTAGAQGGGAIQIVLITN